MSDNGKPISRGRRKLIRAKAERGFDLSSFAALELLGLIDAQSDELQKLRRQVKKLLRERDPMYMKLP